MEKEKSICFEEFGERHGIAWSLSGSVCMASWRVSVWLVALMSAVHGLFAGCIFLDTPAAKRCLLLRWSCSR